MAKGGSGKKKKTNITSKKAGASLIVSGFFCSCRGLFRSCDEQSSENPVGVEDCTKIMYPGANKDGYFNNENLSHQNKQMLKMFEIMYPSCLALVAFDNSYNYHAMAYDALVEIALISKMVGRMSTHERRLVLET